MPSTSTSTITISSCPYCDGGGHRVEQCPQVRVIHYRKDGTISAVEKMTPTDRAVYPPAPSYPAAPIQWSWTWPYTVTCLTSDSETLTAFNACHATAAA